MAEPSNVTVRPAALADLPAILAIYNESGVGTTSSADEEPHTLEQRRAWLEEHDRHGYAVLVAQDVAGTVVGWGSVSAYHRRAGYRFTAEDSIYVALARCGEGIGSSLLGPLIEAARARGLRSLVAVIAGHNEPSVRLHRRFGFEHVGTLRDAVYKFGQWQDIVYMQRML